MKLAAVLACVGLWSLSGSLATPPETKELKVGDPAPDFTLQASDGKVYKLSELRGRPVVLAWFPKAFTGGCTAECRSFRDAEASLRGFEVLLFPASVDTPETNAKFAESLGLTVPILSDPDKTTAKAYGVLLDQGYAARHTFYIGPDGKLLFIDRQVNTASAGDDVAKRLGALGIREKK
jgi:peroxiredoxin Q/BCP